MQSHISGITCYIVAGAVIIACAVIICMPCTLCHTCFIKLIFDTFNCIFACHRSAGTAKEVMPVFSYLCPTAGRYTDLRIAPFTVDLNESGIFALILAIVTEVVVNAVNGINTCYLLTVSIVVISVPAGNPYTVNICFSVCPFAVIKITADFAFKHSVNNLVAMSRCRNCRSPIYNRVANIAVCSACVSRFSTCCSFIIYCICSVDMSAVPGIIICFAFIG